MDNLEAALARAKEYRSFDTAVYAIKRYTHQPTDEVISDLLYEIYERLRNRGSINAEQLSKINSFSARELNRRYRMRVYNKTDDGYERIEQALTHTNFDKPFNNESKLYDVEDYESVFKLAPKVFQARTARFVQVLLAYGEDSTKQLLQLSDKEFKRKMDNVITLIEETPHNFEMKMWWEKQLTMNVTFANMFLDHVLDKSDEEIQLFLLEHQHDDWFKYGINAGGNRNKVLTSFSSFKRSAYKFINGVNEYVTLANMKLKSGVH